MAYISQKIPNLVNGVSQQPDDLSLFSQGQDQVNGFSSVVEGLKKRPPTEYIAKFLQAQILTMHLFILLIEIVMKDMS